MKFNLFIGESGTMKTLVQIVALLIIIPAFALVVSSCGKSNAESQGQQEADNRNVVYVQTEEIRLSDFREIVQVTGSIESYKDIMVPAEEGGRVVEWKVPLGASVSKGQVLAKLDDAVLRAGFDAANANYELAEVTYKKQSKVFEEQAISEWQLKSYQYQRDAAKAQADLAKARLEKTLIRSPISGVLNKRMAEEGEMIGPGMPLAHVVNTSRLRIAAGIPERYAGRFKIGDPVRFTIDAFPGEVFDAKISFVGAAVNRDNRSLPIEAYITSSGGKLKPEMIANMKITLANRPNAIVIAEDYLQQVDKEKFVVFIAEGGVARERTVTVEASQNGAVMVSQGLKSGEKLITRGHQNVADGQAIEIQK